MPRKRIPDEQRLVTHGVRISPEAVKVMKSLPWEEKKRLLAKLREITEIMIKTAEPKALQVSDNSDGKR